MRHSQIKINAKIMIRQDQQKRILSLGFKIKIYSTSLEEGSKEEEEGSSKPT